MINSIFLKLLAIFCLIISFSALSKTLTPQDDDPGIMGRAYSSLTNRVSMVSRAMIFCAKEDTSFSELGKSVTTSWHQRNDEYLPLGPIFLSEIRAKAIREGDKAQWEEIESVTMPKMHETVSNSLVDELNKLSAGQQRNDACKKLARSINDGVLDIDHSDPSVVALLNRRLKLLKESQ